MLPVIQVENLSKAYQIGEFSTGTLTNDIQRWFIRMRGKEDPYFKIGETSDRIVSGESNIVWSLKDINFEIKQGDAVGIIGRNGAGKSTLLKVLSRVTTPTAGTIKVKGRIASLLEVGTGFHPELTGKENIFLNGAILGMRKYEIRKRFDQIVDFSGVERYINTPVKRYSSGMYVRLAFAVAAHLESEILIVDEVLAVGDVEFQRKCLGKMGDVSKGEGRTVLFVSHNMAAIKSLCTEAILLKRGKTELTGSVQKCVSEYLVSNENKSTFVDLETIPRDGNGKVIFSTFHIENEDGQIIENILTGDNICFVFKLKINDKKAKRISVGFSLHNVYDDMQSYLYSAFQEKYYSSNGDDYLIIKCLLNDFPFSQGRLSVKGRIEVDGEQSDWPSISLGMFDIEFGDFYNTGVTVENIAPFLIKGTWD